MPLPTTTPSSSSTNAQWNTRLPTSRRVPFSAATAVPDPSTATRKRLRLRTGAAEPIAAAGSAGTVRWVNSGNASSSRAWIGRWRIARSAARERGSRHATSDVNSSTTISENHHEPNTSNRPVRRNTSPQNGWSPRYWVTFSGLFGICGTSDPATDASASISSSTRAVRIDRNVRQTRASERPSVNRSAKGEDGMRQQRCYSALAIGGPRPAQRNVDPPLKGRISTRVKVPVISSTPTRISRAPDTSAMPL